jgi:thiamine-phosphate diphosphorylase
LTSPRTGVDLSTYLVTDAELCGPRGTAHVVAAAVRGGATCVQVRAKSVDGRDFLALVGDVVEAAAGVPVLVNDRLDVALAARALGVAVAGVHIGPSDLPAPVVRALLWPGALLGVSVTRFGDLADVAAWPPGTVDYLGVGPVRATATKPGHAPALGPVETARIAAGTPLPCVAIGGMDAGLARVLGRAGLAGAAYVSAICAADRPEDAARALAHAWAG